MLQKSLKPNFAEENHEANESPVVAPAHKEQTLQKAPVPIFRLQSWPQLSPNRQTPTKT